MIGADPAYRSCVLRTLLSGLALTLAACACKQTPATPAATAPSPEEPTMTPTPALSPAAEVRNPADRDAKSGDLVEVFGTYEQVAGGKDPDAPNDGHAAVRLDDGSLVHLQPPWHPDAIRSADELTRYTDKQVVVKGLLFKECPPPPDNRAYAQVPCLYAAIVIIDRRTYDALQRGTLE